MPDPSGELFDIVTPEGLPTGRTKPRAEVHQDGDWHRAFHLWIGWRDSDRRPRLLLQRRSPQKDTWPGRLDVAVGGHYAAGETLDDVFREVEEELGFRPDRSECVSVGVRRVESVNPNWTDREIQDVFVLALPDGPPQLSPCPDELIALTLIDPHDLTLLIYGGASVIRARQAAVLPDRTLGRWEPIAISIDDLVPARDNYWLAGADLVVRALTGKRPLTLSLS